MIVESFETLVAEAQAWFEDGRAAGWLDSADFERFARVEQATPGDLFTEPQMRPLVVAFFGGTGVGKSSLLNRLAGEPLAATGVERPTSRDVTVYLHVDVQLADLPPELPLANVRVRRHSAAARREIVWIDAPDIDSTEEANRRCALAWLPHVDLLVYVVSPERYRDDAGWEVLLERGQRHGWMFVMNHWDEGDPRQRADFAAMLRRAGFEDPLLLCTCCAEARRDRAGVDEFAEIETTLQRLLKAHGVRELTRLGHRARLFELRAALAAAEAHLGTEDDWRRLVSGAGREWERSSTAISAGAQWGMSVAAGRLAVRETGLIGQVRRGVAAARGSPTLGAQAGVGRETGSGARRARSEGGAGSRPDSAPDLGELNYLTTAIWDDWSQAKLGACFDALEVSLRKAGLAARPARRRLDALGEKAGKVVIEHVQDSVRATLSRPGGLLQRMLRRVTGFFTTALPAAALAWVAYQVVTGYYRASTGTGSFFGTGFAVHSGLLVLVAWALPFTIDRLLRPSLERAVLGAMRQGLASGLEAVGAELQAAMRDAEQESRQRREAAGGIVAKISGLALTPIRMQGGPLARVIAAAPAKS
ncbi:MAG: GTPase domain-containing protein [Planctomycetes bacterium]|nr:GTPase domain-containing protein [Planctomycetota bacterium]